MVSDTSHQQGHRASLLLMYPLPDKLSTEDRSLHHVMAREIFGHACHRSTYTVSVFPTEELGSPGPTQRNLSPFSLQEWQALSEFKAFIETGEQNKNFCYNI